MGLPDAMEVYVDTHPDAPIAHAAFRLRSHRDAVLDNPAVAQLGQQALDEGFTDGGYEDSRANPYTGDVFQIGGVFVVGAGNVCDFTFRSRYAGDHPDPATLLEAATGIRSDGSELTPPATAGWLERLGATKEAAAVSPPTAASGFGRLSTSLFVVGACILALSALLASPPSLLAPPPKTPPKTPVRGIGGLLRVLRLDRSQQPAAALEPAASALVAPAALYAAVFIGVVLVVVAFTLRLVSDRAQLSQPEGSMPSAKAVRLLVPSEIDDLAVDRQLITCNCSRVTEGTDMEIASTDFSKDEIFGIDTLSTLDAFGTLTAHADASPPPPTSPGRARLTNADVHQLRLANWYVDARFELAPPSKARAQTVLASSPPPRPHSRHVAAERALPSQLGVRAATCVSSFRSPTRCSAARGPRAHSSPKPSRSPRCVSP
jgi:hypothetical protein